MFRFVGNYFRYALQKNYITKDDLYTTDQQVLDKVALYHYKDEKLKYLFLGINNKIPWKEVAQEEASGDTSVAEVFCKSRLVDPLCYNKGEVRRVSEINSGWTEILEKELKPKQYFLKTD